MKKYVCMYGFNKRKYINSMKKNEKEIKLYLSIY